MKDKDMAFEKLPSNFFGSFEEFWHEGIFANFERDRNSLMGEQSSWKYIPDWLDCWISIFLRYTASHGKPVSVILVRILLAIFSNCRWPPGCHWYVEVFFKLAFMQLWKEIPRNSIGYSHQKSTTYSQNNSKNRESTSPEPACEHQCVVFY